ncbi:hypothetical protein GCM10008967_39850 [Bacillus carboniphilus]|uniref:histidine kinase n=1 Tax=Bacillus carboniphilus TaxID=86663 RepID=A0ABN0WSF7_9BACI
MKITEIDAREILDRITDGFFALDTHWKFTYVNEEATKLLCRRGNDLVGKQIWSEFPEAVELPFYEQYNKAVQEQVSVNFDAYYPPPLDTWYDVRAYPSENGLTVYFQDVTKEKKASAKHEQHYKSLFEHNPDAVYSLDLNGYCISVNSATEKLLGFRQEEYPKLSFIPFIAEEDLDKTIEFFEKAKEGETQNYETKVIHKEGHVIHVNVTNMPIIVDQEVVGVYGIAKDITDQKHTEQELVKSEKLSAVGQLSASIAHEIRNPLTALKGFLQLINASTGKDIEESYLEVMAGEIEWIDLITGELLLLAKPQAHHFKFEQIQEIFKDVKMLLGSQALMNRVDIKVIHGDLPRVRCVGNQLKQVFINLIKNAIESMPNGGEITVEIKQKNKRTLSILVTDEGCGIPEEVIENIGMPFYTTKQKGTGLGLMTSLKIIEAHQGTIDFSSKVGEGTTVRIDLPIDFRT